MPSFTEPLWLIGLAAIPLIWWLHRLGDADAATPVSAAFLFYGTEQDRIDRRSFRRANPLWLLRALLYSLLVLALAGLHLPGRGGTVTVWFDDSLSMRTQEQGGPRISHAAHSLASALAEEGAASIRLHALGDHGDVLEVPVSSGDALARTITRWAGRNPPRKPEIPFRLPAGTRNWLVTDGSDRRVVDWSGQAPFSRVIATGTSTENAAVTALAARRSLQPGRAGRGSVRVHNLGVGESSRTLTVQADGRAIFTEDITVPSGASAFRSFPVPREAGDLSAALLPHDSLALDDELALSLNGLRPVAVDLGPRCGAHMRKALESHPGIQTEPAEGQAGLAVRCARSPAVPPGPSITVHTSIAPRPVGGPVHWRAALPGLSGLPLDPSWLRVSPDAGPPAGESLLVAGEPARSLIEMRQGALHVFLDLEFAPFAGRQEYPLLINALLELSLARPLLDPVVDRSRSPGESLIVRNIESAIGAPAAGQGRGDLDILPWLLMTAGLLLLADGLFAFRAAAKASRAWWRTA